METVVPQLWQTAVIEALNRMTLFQDDAQKKVNILIKILSLDVPAVGIDMTTETSARYEIIDRSSGDIIFTQDITASGTAPFGYSLLGMARVRESVNRAVQNNITQFLQALESVDVQKPMFPVNASGSSVGGSR
jgi:hypothetical protein